MVSINLLPEEEKKEEEKLIAGEAKAPAVSFHMPANQIIGQAETTKQALNTPFSQSFRHPEPKVNRSISVAENIRQNTSFNAPSINSQQKKISSREIIKQDLKAASYGNLGSGSGIFKSLFRNKKQKSEILKNQLDSGYSGELGGKNFDVNLIPEGSDLLPSSAIYKSIAMAALYGFAAAAILYASLMGMSFYFKQENSQLSEQLNAVVNKFNQLQKLESDIMSSNGKLALAKNLFNNHVYWTQFFEFLEKNTLAEVYYTSISSARDGTISLSGVGENYLAVARQYLVFQRNNEAVQSVSLSGLASDENGVVKFTANILVNPSILNKKLD